MNEDPLKLGQQLGDVKVMCPPELALITVYGTQRGQTIGSIQLKQHWPNHKSVISVQTPEGSATAYPSYAYM